MSTSPQIPITEAGSLNRRAARGWVNLAMIAAIVVLVLVALIAFLFPFGARPLDKDLITYQVRKSDLVVTVVEQGTLESSENTEIKCKVRGQNTVTWVIESGTEVSGKYHYWMTIPFWEGDELLRLDTLALEESITERKKFMLLTRASEERLRAAAKSAELAIKEYEEGTYVAELKELEKNLQVAKSNLKAAENGLRHNERLAEKGFVNELQIAELVLSVKQYEQQVKKLNADIFVLKNFTKEEQLTTLKGDSKAAIANHEAERLRSVTDKQRYIRAVEEKKYCVVRAPRPGLVIHPSAAQWEGAPEIEEGATVHKTQVMLLMPNLDKMQVKVGIHESIVARVKPEMRAVVVLNDRHLESKVQSVAKITRPAGWWTGNVVKYDTIIKLPENEPGLKPGMSAEVQVILASYEDVVTVPVAGVLQTELGNFCWVKEGDDVKRRVLELGDSNDVFIHVKSGLDEGDEVVLNPLDYISEAEREALMPQESDEDGLTKPAEQQKPQGT